MVCFQAPTLYSILSPSSSSSCSCCSCSLSYYSSSSCSLRPPRIWATFIFPPLPSSGRLFHLELGLFHGINMYEPLMHNYSCAKLKHRHCECFRLPLDQY